MGLSRWPEPWPDIGILTSFQSPLCHVFHHILHVPYWCCVCQDVRYHWEDVQICWLHAAAAWWADANST